MNADAAQPSPSIDTGTCFAMDERPAWKRIASRFFQHHPPSPDLPEWAKDGITSYVEVNFCWKDRLRILLTGNVSVKIFIACENPPGRLETQSHAIAPFETHILKP